MEKLKIKIVDAFGTLAMVIMMNLKDIIELLLDVVITFVVCFVVTKFFFMPVQVSGSSMYPTLQDNQIGFSSIVSRRISGIERYDIVVVQDKFEDRKLVKRVIGLPGETICCVNDCIYVNGSPIDETYLDQDYIESELNDSDQENFTSDFVITLGEDEYFVLGDNRLHSLDSRYYGAFTSDEILAKGVFIIYPFNSFGKAK